MTNKGSMWPQGSTVVLPGKNPFIVNEPDGMCPSTHGGAGYAEGSYWDDGAIVCGICEYRIENPPPTGGRWVPAGGFINRLLGRGEWVHDCYPDFIPSKKPKEKDKGYFESLRQCLKCNAFLRGDETCECKEKDND